MFYKVEEQIRYCYKETIMYIILLLLYAGTAIAQPQPNIIVIVADDLGWNDLSFHGSPQIPTPNLDFLAKNGIILDNYYVCPVCSPSRGSLMTGMYPIHTGLQHGVITSSHPWGLPLDKQLLPEWLKEIGYVTYAVGKLKNTYEESGSCPPNSGLQHEVIFVNEPWGLPLNYDLLPKQLRNLGYATHAVGKWHLGYFRKEYTPTYRGFDSHYGYWGGKEDYFDHTQQLGEMWGTDFHHNMTTLRNALGNYSTKLFTNQAVNIINQHNVSKPLFLYLAHQAVHSANSYAPLQAPPEYIARFPNIKDENRRTFAGMVSAMDDSVGLLLKGLHDKGLLKNSIIVFTTDNGGPAAGFNNNAASNWPLRGVKATLWEGGVRGIAFLWSPLLKNTGHVSMNLMHITDWLPTLYHAAGGDVKNLGSLDGYDMWNSLSLNLPSPRYEVLLNIDPISKVSALRVGNYKIVQGTLYNGQWDGWYGPSGRENATEDNGSDEYMSVELNCGPKPSNASTNCRPLLKPCLFNVQEDPCEYNNVAETEPQVLKEILERLAYYNSTAVPPGNKPLDPQSNPKLHDYAWINWQDYV